MQYPGIQVMKAALQGRWYEGHDVDVFNINNLKCHIVRPHQIVDDKPWIWRTEFLGAFPSVDVELLKRGFHVAHIAMDDMYGAPSAMTHMDDFYNHVCRAYGLSTRMTLEGFSRGGLFALNWASRHPEKVASIYLDAPVCDPSSWPGGKGKSTGSLADWERLLKLYKLSEDEFLARNFNPLNHLEPISAARIPIISVCGVADDIVPVEENTAILVQKYKKLGGKIVTILKPGVGHHPHSLADPTPIIEFILMYAK